MVTSLFTIPETRYAVNGDVHLAYQTLGEGPPDIISVSAGPTSHIEHIWEEPAVSRASRRLATLGRLIHFDNRGVGLSDPTAGRAIPTMLEQVDDIRAVLDAAGSERTVLLGYVSGCAPSIVFAATYPERVERLILCAPYARLLKAEDYPIGVDAAAADTIVQCTLDGWGKGAVLPALIPSMANDVQFRSWWAQLERLGASPGTAARFVRQWFDVDVRSVLPSVHVPTLVFGRKGKPLIPTAHARYVAERIPGARFVELEGSDLHFSTGDTEPYFEEIETFIGTPHEQVAPERSLGTVLFIDIVGSTELALRIGDARWRDLQEAYFQRILRELERCRGRLMDTAGDGALAVFDAPGRAIACAEALRAAARRMGIEIRAGLHTGEIEARDDGGVGGIAVHIGARIAALADAGEILVSRTIRDLIAGSSIELSSRGSHTLKGLPEPWELYAVAA